jgi:hypothetical protein
MLNKTHLATFTLSALLITACGGSSDKAPVENITPLPSFSLSVSDAPVDDLSEEMVQIPFSL